MSRVAGSLHFCSSTASILNRSSLIFQSTKYDLSDLLGAGAKYCLAPKAYQLTSFWFYHTSVCDLSLGVLIQISSRWTICDYYEIQHSSFACWFGGLCSIIDKLLNYRSQVQAAIDVKSQIPILYQTLASEERVMSMQPSRDCRIKVQIIWLVEACLFQLIIEPDYIIWMVVKQVGLWSKLYNLRSRLW
jgi:hypothetical protein